LDSLRAGARLQEEAKVVAFGCPQMTLTETEEVARHFVGRKVRKRTLFHLVPEAYAAFAGTDLHREVVKAGVEVWRHCPLAGLSLRIGIGGTDVLTPSGKLHYYLAGTRYGSLDDVLRVCGVLD
jgi:predicted aconitase